MIEVRRVRGGRSWYWTHDGAWHGEIYGSAERALSAAWNAVGRDVPALIFTSRRP